MKEILIVDDERTVRASYRRLFEGEGYAVRDARSGADALRLFDERRPDLVLLDVDMPGMNGYAVCRAMRERDPATPILFLTAMESDADQLRGLGVGADDYVFKTASNAVLVARVASALARLAALSPDSSAATEAVSLGRVVFHVDGGELALDGKPMPARLTRTEAGILRILVRSRGRSLSFGEIVEGLRGEGQVMEDSTIRAHMAHIREKLGPAGGLIVTERGGSGYRLLR